MKPVRLGCFYSTGERGGEPLSAPAVNCGPDHATIVEIAATTPANTVATRAKLISIAIAV